jgi:hypothetical protein
MKPFGFLAIKTSISDTYSYFHGEPMIHDICVVKRSAREELPERYMPVERDSQGIWSSLSADLTYAVRFLPAMGLCNLAYEAVTLDRYPLKDISPHISLPEEALPVFAFPRNLHLEMALNSEYPLPVFYTFVFTDAEGHHMFAACLKFFEKVPLDALEPIATEIYGNSNILDLPPDAGIFCPKVICVLSHKPFYRGMGRYLKHIYSLSLSSSICPLEYFITSVVSKVPLPCDGGRPFHIVLDAALIAPTSRPMKPIIFKVPSLRSFPLMDLDFAGPMRCLSVDLMLAVFVLMLREAKILFLSSSNTMLTETMETLRCLLFPLDWSSCFVSRLPKTLSGLLQAPGGFMVGLHIESSELVDLSGSNSKGNKSSKTYIQEMMKKYIQYMHFDYPMLAGTYIIDLNSNCAYMFNGKYSELLSHSQIDNLLKTLPSGPKLRLKTKLTKIAEEYQIAPQIAGFEELDSAFDFQQHQNVDVGNEETNKVLWEMFPTQDIRDSLMSFMVDLLGEYIKYMKPPNDELLDDTYRTFQEEFSIQEYIHDCQDHSSKQLLEYLLETQMFSVLIQSRSEATAEPLVFFEQAANLQRELGLSAGGHSIPSNHKSLHNGICELPEPLYVLLEAELRWSNLSKVMQQQILQQSFLFNFEDKTLKQYSLKYINHSSLAQIRSLGQGTESFHPVHNQKLLDLLIFIDFSNGMTELDGEESTNNLSYSILRTELDRGEDLHLAESIYGALILPGPIIPNYDPSKAAIDDGRSNSPLPIQYTYKDGWPALNQELLKDANEYAHSKLPDLITERAFAINKIDPIYRLLIRSPSERLTAENVAKLRSSNLLNDKNLIHKDITTSLSALLDIASLSISMLSIRVMNKIKPINDLLQILGIVSQIEYSGIQFYLSENIWRAILVCCSVTGGDVSRRISVLIRDALLSMNIHFDALTYGQYIKANHAAKVKTPAAKIAGEVLDQFYHLEEMGLTWFQQKSSSPDKPANISPIPPANPPTSTSSSSRRYVPPVKTPLQEATDVVIKQLILQRSEGLLPFFRPRPSSAMCIPRHTSRFPENSHLEIITVEMQSRLTNFYVLAKNSASLLGQHFQQQQLIEKQLANQKNNNERSSSEEKKAQRPSAFSLNPSALSPLSGLTKLGKGFFGGGGGASKPAAAASSNNHNDSPSPATNTPPRSLTSSFAKFLGGGMGGGNKNNNASRVSMASSSHSIQSIPENGGNTELDQVNLHHEIEGAVELTDIVPTNVEEPHDIPVDQSKLPAEGISHTSSADPQHSSDISRPESSSDLVTDPLTIAVPTTPTKVSDPPSEEHSVADAPPVAPAAPAREPLSNNQLQDRLLEVFSIDFTGKKRSLAIHDYNPCWQCGYVLMDEEIMNAWFRGSSIDVHQPKERLRSCRDMNEDKGIHCPECEKSIHPRLYVTCYELQDENEEPRRRHSSSDGNSSRRNNDETSGELNVIWKQEVLFINPFLLRFEMEELIIKFGERVNQVDWLFRHYPAILWNIIWFTNRIHLPSGLYLPSSVIDLESSSSSSSMPTTPMSAKEQKNLSKKKGFDDFIPKYYSRKEYEIISSSGVFEEGSSFVLTDLLLPVMIGWRKSVVKSKILRLLQGKSGNYLDIRDMFPNCSSQEFEIITGPVLSNLDGSPIGMRQSMLHFIECKSLFEPILLEYQRSKEERRQEKLKLKEQQQQHHQQQQQHPEEGNENPGGDGHFLSFDSDSEEESSNAVSQQKKKRASFVNNNNSSSNKSSASNPAVPAYRSATRKKNLEIARLLYMNLLILSVHFAKFQLFDPTKNGFNRDLERVSSSVIPPRP